MTLLSRMQGLFWIEKVARKPKQLLVNPGLLLETDEAFAPVVSGEARDKWSWPMAGVLSRTSFWAPPMSVTVVIRR